MAEKKWEMIKIRYCNHVGCEVGLEAELIYPPEYMPDQPPRVSAHRCSRGKDCMLMEQASCVWAGSNPAYDPFEGKEGE